MMIQMRIFPIYDKEKVLIIEFAQQQKKNIAFYYRIHAQIIN
jgi:hypothetical protein